MNIKVSIYSLIILTFSYFSQVHAYIPSSQMILNKTAKTHAKPPGKGGYGITLEVTFINPPDDLRFKERWIIEHAESMLLTVTSASSLPNEFNLQYFYKGKQRFFKNDESETMVVSTDSASFFEKFFHYRTGNSLKSSLIEGGIIPQTTPPPPAFQNQTDDKENTFTYQPEPFVRFSRVGGTVTYALGTPAPPKAISLPPQIWIEQDNFFIRKIRLPSQEELSANDYQKNSAANFWFPKNRILKWNNKVVQIKTLSVEKINIGPKTRKLLNRRSLKPTITNVPTNGSASIGNTVHEFYSRFR